MQEVLPREVAAQKPDGKELANRAKQILRLKRPAAAAATPGAVKRPAGAMGPGVMRRPAKAAKGEAGAMGAAAAVAAGGEPEDDGDIEEECLEPAVAEGAGGESEAEEDCDIAEPAPKRAARDKEKGCSKCRWKPKGCGQCRQLAQAGLHGYYFQDDEVIAGGAVTLPRKRWASKALTVSGL